jgi:predicted membrane channel-forming protein YqfA (hemolysin III family)
MRHSTDIAIVVLLAGVAAILFAWIFQHDLQPSNPIISVALAALGGFAVTHGYTTLKEIGR